MDSELVAGLQKQLNHERNNAQKYYYIAHGMENMAYDGFAKFFQSQADGEMKHAAVIANLLISKRVMPEYYSVPAVILEASVPYYASYAFQTELLTTQALQELYNMAYEAGDGQVCAVLDDLLKEQVEEENVAADFVDRVTRTDANGWEVLNEKYNK